MLEIIFMVMKVALVIMGALAAALVVLAMIEIVLACAYNWTDDTDERRDHDTDR